MSLNYRELKRRYDLDGAEKTSRYLCEALSNRELAPEDFSLRDLAEALVPDGRQWVRMLDPRAPAVVIAGERGPVSHSNRSLLAPAFSMNWKRFSQISLRNGGA